MKTNGVTGAVLPSANFEPLPWVLSFEEAGLVLAHNSLASAQRIIKLNDPHMTGLSRLLGTDQTVQAFATGLSRWIFERRQHSCTPIPAKAANDFC